MPYRCRHILLASYAADVDLTPAVRAASALAARHGADVAVAVAFEPPIAYPGASCMDAPAELTQHVAPEDAPALEQQLVRARLALAAAKDDLAEWPLTLEVGHAPVGVVRAAQRRDADLVIVPLPTIAPDDEGSLGRRAALIAVHASVPVLAVADPLRHPVRRLLVAVGLDQAVVNAARVAGALFPAPTEIELVHVTDRLREVQDAVRAQMDRVEAALALPDDCRVERRILLGTQPWRALLARAQYGVADVVVGSTHGRTSTERTLLRNTALRMLASARCSMLIVPGEPARDCLPADGGPA